MTMHELQPDVFIAGTVGPPGQRVFYLQSQCNGTICSVRLEKQQVAALAEYLSGMLHDLPTSDEEPPSPTFVEPSDAEWVVGTIGVAYDNDRQRIIIHVQELHDTEDDDAAFAADELRVAITLGQVQAFIDRADELMSGGRPPCRLCGGPIDRGGHACPRHN